MGYYVANPLGDSIDSLSLEQMQRFLDTIDVNDVEHGAAWLCDDEGNALEFNGDGILVFDREDNDGTRHLAGVSKQRAMTLWLLLAQGRLDELEREPWKPGLLPPEEAARRRAEAEQSKLKADRQFYDLLGPERPGSKCRKDNCGRGCISHSVFYRTHHFESLRQRPCPFTD